MTTVIHPPQPPPPDVSEAAFQRLVCDLATVCGWTVIHNADSRRTQAGVPDLLLIRGKVLLWRELKRRGGVLRPPQVRFGILLCRAGCDWAVWKPSDWETIVRELTAVADAGHARE